MSKFKEVLGQVGIYTSAFALTQLISVVGAILVRYFLGPLQTGVWSLVQVVLTYIDYANLGATYAIPIELPLKRAQGKIPEAEKMKNVMFSFSFLTSVLFAFGVLIYAFWHRPSIPVELFYGLLIASGLAILQQMNNVLISLLRAYKNFKLAGAQMALSAAVNLVLTVILSSLFKLYGFMFAMALSFLFNILFVFYHESFRLRWEIDLKVLKGLIQYGLPLMILAFAGTLLLTIDKIMVAKYLGLEALGLYSIAVMTSGFICSVPNAIGVVLLPNVSEKYAEGESVHNLKSYLVKSNHIFSILMPLVIGFAWFLVPLMIHFLIPKFMGGIAALKCLALGTFFIGLTQTYSNFIVVSKKHFRQFPITIAMCLLAFTAILLAIRSGIGINGVGIIMAAVMAVNFMALHLFVGSHIFQFKESALELIRVLAHFVLMLAVLLMLNSLFGSFSWIARAFWQCLLLVGLYTPFLIQMNKTYAIGSILMEKIFKKSRVCA